MQSKRTREQCAKSALDLRLSVWGEICVAYCYRFAQYYPASELIHGSLGKGLPVGVPEQARGSRAQGEVRGRGGRGGGGENRSTGRGTPIAGAARPLLL